jgi:hypothetical protein
MRDGSGLFVFEDVFICVVCNRASVGSCRMAGHLNCTIRAGDAGAIPFDVTNRVHRHVVLDAVTQLALSTAHTACRLQLEAFAGTDTPAAVRRAAALEYVGSLALAADPTTAYGRALHDYATGVFVPSVPYEDGTPAPPPTPAPVAG